MPSRHLDTSSSRGTIGPAKKGTSYPLKLWTTKGGSHEERALKHVHCRGNPRGCRNSHRVRWWWKFTHGTQASWDSDSDPSTGDADDYAGGIYAGEWRDRFGT